MARPQSGPRRLRSLQACHKTPKAPHLILQDCLEAQGLFLLFTSLLHGLNTTMRRDDPHTQCGQLRVLPAVSILTSSPQTWPACPSDGMQQALGSGLPELMGRGAERGWGPLLSLSRVCSEGVRYLLTMPAGGPTPTPEATDTTAPRAAPPGSTKQMAHEA